MIIVSVQLKSAITGATTELARMHISNRGDQENPRVGNYDVATLHGRNSRDLDAGTIQRRGAVERHRRLDEHVWRLVSKALRSVGYAEEARGE